MAQTRIEGLQELDRELEGLGDDIIEAAREEVAITLYNIDRLAKQSIQRGPATGRVYEKYNPRRTHRASAPGEAPATDTGRLVISIHPEIDADGLGGEVGTDLEYGLYLEHGTTEMAARPWLNPAAEEERPKHEERMAERVDEAIRKRSR